MTTPTTPASPSPSWERPETAVSAGLRPYSVTEPAARRRTGDAGRGRAVVIPIYVLGSRPGQLPTHQTGLLVTLSPAGEPSVDRDLFPPQLGRPSAFWPRLLRAADEPGAVVTQDGWTQVALDGRHADGEVRWGLAVRAGDWALVRAALAMTYGDPTRPQDAAVAERVVARFLGRLDGLDGTATVGLWGRLALEVVSHHHASRLADTVSLRWYASTWEAGLSSSGAARDSGSGGSGMLLDLRYGRIRVLDGLFGVRTLPDWERESAAHDLGLPARRVLAWPVVPLAAVLARFQDIAPAPLDDVETPQDDVETPQDAASRRGSSAVQGPQDAR